MIIIMANRTACALVPIKNRLLSVLHPIDSMLDMNIEIEYIYI